MAFKDPDAAGGGTLEGVFLLDDGVVQILWGLCGSERLAESVDCHQPTDPS